jgi:heptaprenyl diphosphate synthase
MEADLEQVEQELLASVTTHDQFLTEIATHLIRAGGKRIRPAFSVAAAACATGYHGVTSLDVLRGGVAVELVHLGSLYHDDVIDDAVTRRTVPSVNARWGNLRAILAGDFLLARSSEIAASLGSDIAALLANTIARLCEGELAELQTAFQTDRTRDDYFAAIGGKTAALLSAACRVGAIVGGLGPDEVERLTEFGRAYGIAFQIVDDVLDLVATEEQLGKPVAHDLVEGIYNLPVIDALAGPNGQELREVLGKPTDADSLSRARSLVLTGTAIDSAIDEALRWCGRARHEIESLGERPGAVAFAASADHLLDQVRAVRPA